VLDIDTGVLRRGHVLVLRSPQAELTLGLGAASAALMEFAQKGETRDNSLFEACDKADQAIARGDFETARKFGVPDVISTIENRALRRLALVECFLGEASPGDLEHPGWPAGSPDGLGGKFMPKDDSGGGLEANGNNLLVPVSNQAGTKLGTKAVGNIVFNETRSLSGPGIDEARVAIAHAVRNGEDAQGDKRPRTAPPDVGPIPSTESPTYAASQQAAIQADGDRKEGIDPSKGATHFQLTIGPSTDPFYGAHIRSYGPFNNAYPHGSLNSRTNIYINTYE
jgi:hypothetical protein